MPLVQAPWSGLPGIIKSLLERCGYGYILRAEASGRPDYWINQPVLVDYCSFIVS
ncbi:hypothetical protein Cflav_PD0243 [Pedosphaera parvula Ellin514]|uniref:Uncharacterized protein n=1 Tax=Pedosphaera parvula (strain Ellin514) TaxID=320771 RepID=B9XSA7_PEDPL|nr:hypothetical protein Cflav_PD0243 [Pedosphaera parvula Ellin514]